MIIRNRGIAALVTAVAALALSTTASTGSAYADDTAPPSCQGADTTTASGSCADIQASSSHAQEDSSSVAAASTHGKVLVRYNMASGIKVTHRDKAKGCKLVHKSSQIPAGARCIRGARGFHYVNSGINQAGHLVKWRDSVGSSFSSTPNAKWIRFVKHGGQWFKAGANTGGGNCGNKVWFHVPHPPKLTVKQVILVKSWAHWTFKVKVAASAKATADAKSKSWCNANGTSASATATGSATASAAAHVSLLVKGLQKAKTQAEGASIKLQQDLSLKVNAEAKASAKTKAIANASTQVSCTGSTPPPPSEHPTVSINQVNQVPAGDTATVCANFNVPGSDSGKLTFSSSLGAFPGGSTFTVSGQDQKCTTYQAPNDADHPTSDTLTVSLRDDQTGLSDNTPSDNSTTIKITYDTPPL
jgi:hypothetical protein